MNEEKILQAVCDYFHEDITKVKSPSQKDNYVKMRHIAIYFMDKKLDITERLMGKCFTGRSLKGSGGMNHSTVIHALKTVRNQIETDKFYASNIEALDKIISAL